MISCVYRCIVSCICRTTLTRNSICLNCVIQTKKDGTTETGRKCKEFPTPAKWCFEEAVYLCARFKMHLNHLSLRFHSSNKVYFILFSLPLHWMYFIVTCLLKTRLHCNSLEQTIHKTNKEPKSFCGGRLWQRGETCFCIERHREWFVFGE